MEKISAIIEREWDRVNEFNKGLLKQFIGLSTELSPKTRRSYESNLRVWFYYVYKELNNKRHIDVRPLDAKRFFLWMGERGCTSSDQRNKKAAVSALNIFVETYLVEEQGFEGFRNFMNKSIKLPPQVKKYEKIPLTHEEFEMLVSTLKDKGDLMHVAYLLFSLETGARKNEVRSLLRNVVDAKPTIKEKDGVQTMHYQTHKIRCKGKEGGKNTIRSFIFSERTMGVFREWVDSRVDDNEFMFVHKVKGVVKQVSETYFNGLCDSLEPILGRRFHPHALRYSIASMHSINGVQTAKIQKLLGHASPETTEIYIIKEEEDNLEDLLL